MANNQSSATDDGGPSSVKLSAARWISPEAVACSTAPLAEEIWATPAKLSTAPVVQVAVSNYGILAETDGGSWADLTILGAPVLEQVSPTTGLVAGGTTVLVEGRGFLDVFDLSCAFGSGGDVVATTSAVFIDSNQITCLTPSLNGNVTSLQGEPAAVRVSLTVSNNGVSYSKLGLDFLYVPPPTVSGVYPRVVSFEDVANGRAVVAVSGTGFVQYVEDHESVSDESNMVNRPDSISTNITCRFTGIGDSMAVVARPTMITCPFPTVQNMSGRLVVVVMVSMNGQDFPSDADNGVTLALAPAPRIASVFPEMGPSSGGTRVQLLGEHFGVVDALVCTFRFGTKNTTVNVSAEHYGERLVMCTTPAVPAVEMNDSMSTSEGMLSAVVTVTTAPSSTSVIDEMDIDYSVLEYTYFPSPTVTGLLPETGAPGTLVDVVGDGFLDTPGLMCRFGDTTVAPVAFEKGATNAVTCKVPRQANFSVAVVAVEVSNNMVDWTSNGVNFTYRPRPVLTSVTPKVGPVNGSTIVRIAGSGLLTISNDVDGAISCRFGTKFVSAVSPAASNGDMFCVSPAAGAPGSVNLEVSANGVDLSDSGWRFDYVPDVAVSGVYPLTGPEEGETAVTITGPGFLGLEPVVCEFGAPGFRVAGRWKSRSAFVCDAPPQRPGGVRLAVSTNGQQFVDIGLIYVYQPRATVRSVFPGKGSVNGGTVTAVSGAGFIDTTALTCTVGGRLGEAMYVDSTRVLCRVPAVEKEGSFFAAVRIANNGIDFTEDFGVTFEYIPPFGLLYIEPTVGPTTGGTMLRIRGTGFGAAAAGDVVSCVINGIVAEGRVESPEQLECATPHASNAGPVKLELTRNGVDMSASAVSFLYHLPVEVTSVYPTSVPENGGSKLLVTGSGFTDTDTLACLFTLSASEERPFQLVIERPAGYISDSLLSCESPGGSVGDAEVRVTSNGVDISASRASFSVASASTVTALWPFSGSIDGGTTVRVHGTGFADSSSTTVFCKFGEDVVSADTVLDHTSVTCTSPLREDPGKVNVEISNNGLDWTSNSVTFTYLAPIRIREVSPKIGPAGGGTVVRITGSGFNADVHGGKLLCRFGRRVVSAAVIDSTSSVALCVAPASSTLGSTSFELSSNGVEFSSEGWMFHYGPDVAAVSAWPLAGPESGATVVTFKGKGFVDMRALVCEFGSAGLLVPAKWIHSTMVSCPSPPHVPGNVSLRLSMNGQQFVETGLIFEYRIESAVRSVEPSSGPSQGGTVVEISGTAFVNSTALSCRLAGRRFPATFVNSGRLRCTTPPSSTSSSASLEISNNGADFTNSGVDFTFVPALNFRHMWPTNGPVAGGTSLRVHGSGFLGGGRSNNIVFCVIGGEKALANVRSDEELYCPTPRHGSKGGSVRLQLTNNGVDMTSSPTTFTYLAPIQLKSVSPSAVAEDGGTMVVITGENFIASPYLKCRVGDQVPSEAVWLSSSLASCLIPASPSGPREVTLTVSNNGQDFTDEPLIFTYLPAFTVINNGPGTGPVDGGTEVTLTGAGLGAAGPWACVFGKSTAVPATQVVNGNLRCRSPPQPPGRVSLRVFRSPSPLASAVSGAVAAASTDSLRDFGLTFVYQGAVFVSSVEPRSGSTMGGTPVTLRGFGFSNVSTLTCGFGELNGELLTSPAVRASVGMAVCSSPPRRSDGQGRAATGASPSIVAVTVSLNGVDFTNRGPQYMYYEAVEVWGLFPAIGSADGGTVVTVVGQNFLPSEGLSCRFGASAASPAEFISSDALRCLAPPSPNGPVTVEVTVSNNFVEFSESSATFTYQPPCRPERFSPTAGPVYGGTLVTIEGDGFANATSRLACRFGGIVVKGTLNSSTEITCQSPESFVDKQVPLQVTVNGVEWADAGVTQDQRGIFTYYQPPEITRLQPSTGPRMGGTRVEVFGNHLAPVTSTDGPVLCRFANMSTGPSQYLYSAALAWDSSGLEEAEDVVICQVPDLDADDFATVELTVSTDGGGYFSSPSLMFTYLEVRTYTVYT